MSLAARVLGLALLACLAGSAASGPDAAEYAQRRRHLAEAVGDGVVILFGYEAGQGHSRREPFRQENNFYYLSGLDEPGATMLLVPASNEGAYTDVLFVPERDAHHERWNGPRTGPDSKATGFSRTLPSGNLRSELKKLRERFAGLYTLFPPERVEYGKPAEPDPTPRLLELAKEFEAKDLRPVVEQQRAVKSASEIALIEQAVAATIAGHRAAWESLRPGLWEYQVLAPMSDAIIQRGAVRPAYPPIVGSGPNSVILHYTRNDRRVEPGELILMDVAGEYGHYAADITRTVPADGRFTERQREVYDWVLGAQQAVIAAVRPGMTLGGRGPTSLNQVAEEYFNRRKRGLASHFTHGVGHHVGLDVHDTGSPHAPLQAGMVITVEPGLYFDDEALGVRIEDVILVTEDGCRVLSEALPSDPDEIERILLENR